MATGIGSTITGETKGTPSIFPAPKQATDLKDRDLSWFAQRVEDGRAKPYTEIVTITPDIAKRLLETNTSNRPANVKVIDGIANDILNDRWRLNGETIIVSREGHLLDGQHRLYAIVKANKAVQSFMAFGVEAKARFTVDMGRARSAPNFLAMEGRQHTFQASTVAGLLRHYAKGTFPSTSTLLTKQEIIYAYRSQAAEIDDAVKRFRGVKISRDAGAAALAAAFLIVKNTPGVNPDKLELFFTRVAEGAGLEKGSPILALRDRLAYMKKGSKSPDRVEAILRYWNRFITGKDVKRHLTLVGRWPGVIVSGGFHYGETDED